MKKIKVAILHNIISPHVIPVFELLARQKDLEIKVFFCSETEGNRIWKTNVKNDFPYVILSNSSIEIKGKDLFTYFINPKIVTELNKFKPDVVVSAGWDLFSYQIAYFYSRLTGKKFIIWSGSTVNEPSWRRTIAGLLVKLIVRGSDACIAYGTKAKDYLISLGSSPGKVFIAYNTTDIIRFSDQVNKYKNNKEKIKKELRINTSKVVLFVGQLIERKGLHNLLEAFSKLKTEYDDVSLLIVGYGKLENQYKEYVKEKNIQDVIFAGGVEWEKTPKYYAVADVLVMPSTEEVWGLVINEAMAAGLPVIASNIAGGTTDLVSDGKNGYLVDPGVSVQIYEKLKTIITSDVLRSKMSQESLWAIKNFTPEKSADEIIKAIKYTTKIK